MGAAGVVDRLIGWVVQYMDDCFMMYTNSSSEISPSWSRSNSSIIACSSSSLRVSPSSRATRRMFCAMTNWEMNGKSMKKSMTKSMRKSLTNQWQINGKKADVVNLE